MKHCKKRRRNTVSTTTKTFIAVILASYVASTLSIDPLALHQLIEVKVGGEEVISLSGYDLNGDETFATIHSLPTTGKLYQLSYVYNKHGYEPKRGEEIRYVPATITGSNNRIVYARPRFDVEQEKLRDMFSYSVKNKSHENQKAHGHESPHGNVVLVASSNILVESDFMFTSEEWKIVGSKNEFEDVIHDEASFGRKMNRFIYSNDKIRNVDIDGNDRNLWYFQAPTKFNGWFGLAYDGYLKFDMKAFAGDFSTENQNNNDKLSLVEIDCNSCNYRKGLSIALPLSVSGGFNGTITSFSFKLNEKAGWMMKPKNNLHEWEEISRCEMIEVLSSISNLRILGDITKWNENVAIDNVRIISKKPRGRNHLPPCAQKQPDASKCSC